VEGLDDAAMAVTQLPHKTALRQYMPVAEALLLSHPYITNGFYVSISGGDTMGNAVLKREGRLLPVPLSVYQRQQISYTAAGNAHHSAVVRVADSLHWLATSRYQLADSSAVLLGLDINLLQLQHYLWSVDTTGRAYAFIVDEGGMYLSHPDEQLIGRRMQDTVGGTASRRLGDSVTSYETVTSAYLQLPVLRFSTPLLVAGAQWRLIVDTPMLAVDEDVKAVERYILLLLVSTAVLIIVLIGWAQNKWQKEFMLRQQAELTRQELLAEKQALSLIAERQQKDNALLQLNTLKEKVNPHFLFNSLSSLNALIEQAPELAQSFVMKLSRVYRYVLDAYPDGVATVAAELNFAREYFFLLKIRFGQGLAPLEEAVPQELLTHRIPFMSIQTLIENAVKHNIVSRDMPLHMSIRIENDTLVVTNNLQLRNDVHESGRQGLQYLQRTYSHLGCDNFRYGVEAGCFVCYLPLLHANR
jgi:sensor histidine kinase YesM